MLKIKIGYIMVDKKIKTIAELSRATGINKNTINKLVNDDRPETLTFGNILKLCDFFQCSLSDLVEYTPETFDKDN